MHCPGNTFKSVSDPSMQGQFLSECKKFGGIAECLRGILTTSKYKKDIKCHIYESTISPSTYLVMIHLKNDYTAIELAQKYNFPRGFPIIWIPGEVMYLYGFHPKFSNDQKQIDNVEEFQDADKLHVMLKFSGFLAQFIVWMTEGKLYWTVTSKNAVDNEFTIYAHGILSEWITERHIQQFHKDSIYFCGEAMSQNDQTHGARVLKEGFITTCVGNFIRLEATGNSPVSKFLSILGHDKMYQYCTTQGLPVSDILTIKGQENIMKFAKQLALCRDFISMKSFRDMTVDIPCLKGTIDHEDILGDILEGLVIWIYKGDVSKTIKYKFPVYTTRTFGLRSFLNQHKQMISISFKNHVDKYLDFWVTSKIGKDYWRNWFFTLALKDLVPSTDSKVGEHILLADSINTDRSSDLTATGTFLNKIGFKDESECKEITVIVIVGPIGVGKSTYGQLLAKTLHASGVQVRLIDGDSPPSYSSDVTKLLGQERGAVTLWALVRAVYEGYTPILTAGGGVLFGSGSDLLLKDQLMSLLGVRLNLVLYLPCTASPEDISTFYQNWVTDDIITYRLKSGLWQTGTSPRQFLPQIQKLSQNNVKFAKLLVGKANSIITYQPLCGSDAQVTIPLLPVVENPSTIYSSISASQVRLITHSHVHGRDHYGHVTLVYTTEKLHEITSEVMAALQKLVGLKCEGIWVNAKGWSFISINNAVLAKTLSENGIPTTANELHITVTSGKHYPYLMRSACQQFHNLELSNISLTTKIQDEEIVYSKKDLKLAACKIEVLDVVCI